MEQQTSKILQGPYLVILSVVLFFQFSNCNTLGQIMYMFFIDPVVTDCPTAYKLPSSELCDIDKLCSNNIRININKNETLENWSTMFNFYCPRTQTFKLIVTNLYFIASMLFPALFSTLPDRYGRMKALNILNFALLIAFVLTLFNNQYALMVTMFLCGGLIMIYNIESQVITEYYSSKGRGIITGIYMTAIPIFGIGFIGLFYYVKDIKWFWYFHVGSQALSLLFMNIFYVESPLWLISVGRKKEAFEQLKKAAKFNNKLQLYEEFEQANAGLLSEEDKNICENENQNETDKNTNSNTNSNKSKNEKKYTFIDSFRYPSIRKIIFMVTPLWLSTTLFDFTVFLNLEKSGSNVYMQSIITFIACLTSAISAGSLCDCLGRKKTVIGSAILAIVPYVLTPLFANDVTRGYKFYIETALIFLACVSIETTFTAIIIYGNESFPTSIRSTSYGCMYTFARIGAISAPNITYSLTYPQYVVCPLLFLTHVPFYFLKETKGLELQEDIEEVRNKIAEDIETKIKKDMIPEEYKEEEQKDKDKEVLTNDKGKNDIEEGNVETKE